MELVEYVEYVDCDVEFTLDVTEEDHGIGPYEYFGVRGFDQNIVKIIKKVDWNHWEFTNIENLKIREWIDSNIDHLEIKLNEQEDG